MSKKSRSENGSKRPKDKNAPKRPQSSYFLFSNERRKQLKTVHPDKKVTEISKMIAGEWARMSDADKKPYEVSAQSLKSKYEGQVEAYKGTKQFAEYQELLKKWKAKSGGGSSRTTKIKRAKDPNAPKKPQSAYFLFTSERRPKLKESNPDKKVTEIAKLLGAEWKNMTPASKKPWEERADALKTEYKKKIEAYKNTENYKKFQEELKKQKSKSKKKKQSDDEESEEESSEDSNAKRKAAKGKTSKNKKKNKEESESSEEVEEDDEEDDDDDDEEDEEDDD